MPINTVIHTGEQSVDRVIQAGLPVVLVFWKSGIPLTLDSKLDGLAAANAGKILIAKVDATSETALLDRFNVDRLPSYVFVKDGKTEAVGAGQIPETNLDGWIQYLIHGGTQPDVPQGASEPAAEPVYTPSTPHRNGKTASAQTSHSHGPTATATATKPITLTDSNFASIINQPGTVLVDFWAEWCGPCRMVGPSVEQLANEFQGRAKVGKLNVDQNPATAQRYKIMSIPALYIFKNGQVVDRIVGAQPIHVLRQHLVNQLG